MKFAVLGIEPRVSHVPGKLPATGLYSQAKGFMFCLTNITSENNGPSEEIL